VFWAGVNAASHVPPYCWQALSLLSCVLKEGSPIMKHIVLNAEQARIVQHAGEPVEVRDEQGHTLAHLSPLRPEDMEAIEQSKRCKSLGGPRVSSDQVQAHLRRLGEISNGEGLDEAKMLDLLRRMRAGEAV
jgi:antitoxin (DNA-binding transcriptional repressor) of toxin-antitoxin stability system